MVTAANEGWATGLARLSGAALVLGFLAMVGGGILWSTASAAAVGTSRHVWERGLLMAAIVLTIAGLVLLATHLRGTTASGVVLAGATVYSAAGVLGLAHEAATLSPGLPVASWVLPVYVVAAFLGQAVVGLALTRVPGYPVAIGWVVLAWNVGWLAILPIITPHDLYFPVLHHLMPALIAVPLLTRG